MKRPIAEIRRDAGATQKSCAAVLGIGRSTWGAHERAETHPGRRTMSRNVMIEAVRKVAAASGSGIQVHIEDLVGKPKKRRRK